MLPKRTVFNFLYLFTEILLPQIKTRTRTAVLKVHRLNPREYLYGKPIEKLPGNPHQIPTDTNMIRARVHITLLNHQEEDLTMITIIKMREFAMTTDPPESILQTDTTNIPTENIKVVTMTIAKNIARPTKVDGIKITAIHPRGDALTATEGATEGNPTGGLNKIMRALQEVGIRGKNHTKTATETVVTIRAK